MAKKKTPKVIKKYIQVDRPVTFLKPAKPSLMEKQNSENVLEEIYKLLGLDKHGRKKEQNEGMFALLIKPEIDNNKVIGFSDFKYNSKYA